MKPEATSPEVLNMNQLAAFLGRSRHTIRELSKRANDPIPSHRPGGPAGDRSYIKEDVLAWLRRQ
jgi:predicted DNA-binding transcriptional regulator AlpA